MFRKSLAAACALSLFAASSAFAANSTPSATYTLTITGFVPTICRAILNGSSVPSAQGTVDLGNMNEFCNDGAGYQVWVDYTPSLAGDTLTVGNQQYTLNSSGSVMVDSSTGPASVSKDVSLAVAQAGQSGSVSVRVVSM